MSKIELSKKLKELYDYTNVDVDKEFAIELIPVVELIIINPDVIKRLAKYESNFIQRIYINYCEKHNNIKSNTYIHLIKHLYNLVHYKVYKVLEALYDIVEEDSPVWNTKWRIKPYYKIKYNEVKSNILGVETTLLEPKPEYIEKVKKNEKFIKYNMKRRKECQKWRNSNLNFYKKLLKILNS